MKNNLIPESRLSVTHKQGGEMWNLVKYGRDDEGNIVKLDPEDEQKIKDVADHMAWLSTIPHEIPSPYHPFKIGLYFRYYNQTKYDNYIDYHKAEFTDTIALCPNWELVDYYIDKGQTAPKLDNAPELMRLINDCLSGKVDLIITERIKSISNDPFEITFLSRMLATQKHPIGIYFVNEDMFTLASYYRFDLKDAQYFVGAEDDAYLPELEGGVSDENES